MSVQYSDVPAGGIVPVTPAIPQGMLYRVKQIMGVLKHGRVKTNFKNSTFIRSKPPQPTAKKL
jgi:hypothetical protein